MKILILGGTGEARALAEALVEAGHDVATALAGRTSEPILPSGKLRIGGFGGAEGLANFLRREKIERLVDATHPYADTISRSAWVAAGACSVPLVRYSRPPWVQQPGARWIEVATIAEAAAALPQGAHALITTGHAGLEYLLAREDCRLVVRLIEPPSMTLPPHAKMVLSRPPYSLEDEMALLRGEGITHLLTKNSGGAQTTAKLEAARRLDIAIVMVARPAHDGATETTSLAEALMALQLDG